MRSAAPVLLLGVGMAVAAAATPQHGTPPPILSVKTDLVTLPVTVLDGLGVFVTGLREEHFAVYDGGERQTISFFTSEAVPATIGLVIDSSGSMRGLGAEVAAAAAAFAAMSHQLDEFFTVNFNEAVWPGLPRALDFTEDVDVLAAALSAAPAQGMTALYDALDAALDHLQRGTRDRKALIVVSDGGDNASARPFDAVVAHARRTSAIIYAVTLFERDNRDARPHVLKQLVRETGGRVFTPRRPAEVRASFAQIAREIRSGYTIGFVPPETSVTGFRPVRVTADGGNGRPLSVRTRAGYYAVPSSAAPR